MQTKQDGRLGTEKIGKLMLELALPSVLAQIVNVLYNLSLIHISEPTRH